MIQYIALLRGVNLVGRSTLRMTDLRAIGEELGLEAVRTVPARGNLLFRSDAPDDRLCNNLEQRLKLHTRIKVRVIIRTADEMEAVRRSNPFADARPSAVHAFFLDEPPPPTLLKTVRNQDDERIAIGVREVFVAYGEKGIGRSRLRFPVAQAGTARNRDTVARLAEFAREMR